MTPEQELRKEINRLHAETLALSAVVGFVFSRLAAQDPDLKQVIAAGFDDAANYAESLTLRAGKAIASDHSASALAVIEQLRKIAI